MADSEHHHKDKKKDKKDKKDKKKEKKSHHHKHGKHGEDISTQLHDLVKAAPVTFLDFILFIFFQSLIIERL